jgi:hypothetical protein
VTSSLDQRRFVSYPSVPVEDAVFGFNIAGEIADRPLLDMVAACGARLVRFQPAWSLVEDYDTGVMTLPPTVAHGLDDCAELGLTPIMVAGYGPPYKTISRPVLIADAPVGSTVLRVDNATPIDPPYCHIQRYPNTQIVREGKWAYYGALIDSADQAAGTVTLASATAVSLTAGTELQVNRLRYASLPDKNPTHPSAIAFVRLCLFLANEIAARKIGGFVNIWNEPPWGHDCWDNRAAFYDAAPPELVVDGRIVALVRACAASRPPTTVRYINGATDKTAGSSAASLTPALATEDTRDAMSWESIHPYHVNPEGFLWDPTGSDDAGNWALTPAEVGGNFRTLNLRGNRYALDHDGVKPTLIGTELGCGYSEPAIPQAHAAKARYLVRRVLAQWGCTCPPVIYSFATGSSCDVVDRATRDPYPAYLALQRLMALVAQVGRPSPSQWVPAITGVPDSTWPAMFVSVHGHDGAVLFAWQRTYSSLTTPSSWTSIQTPTPVGVQISITPGSSIAECVNVVTGASVPPTGDAENVTVPITDEVVALRVRPT